MVSNLSFSLLPPPSLLLFFSHPPSLLLFPFILSEHWPVIPFFRPSLSLMTYPHTISTWTGIFQSFPQSPCVGLQFWTHRIRESHHIAGGLPSTSLHKITLLKLNPSKSSLAILKNRPFNCHYWSTKLLLPVSSFLVTGDRDMKEIFLYWIHGVIKLP